MLGSIHFLLPYSDQQDIEVLFNQDTGNIWFEILSVFPDVSLVSYKNGEFIRAVSDESEDMVPHVYLDSVAVLEAAASIKDEPLYNWLEEAIDYFEAPEMDWTMFKEPMEA